MDLHKLRISSPDGIGRNTEVTLDGQQIRPLAITLRADGGNTVSAVIEFGMVSVEFDGMAEVVAKLVRDGEAAEVPGG